MANYHYLHLSNRTEKLYQELKERLFASSHPFTKRIIIVPSAAMKSWLMLQMAADPEIGISAGIEVGFIDPTLNNLYKTLSLHSPQEADPCEPSELELALALEEAITAIAVSYGTSGNLLQKEWLPLVQYLGVKKSEGKTLSKQIHKRIMAMASMLAKLFGEYGVSGGDMVSGWTQGNPAWQGLLWKQMESVFSTWNYPAKKLAAFDMDATVDPRDIQVHLFGLSFLAPLHHRFLQKIAAQLPVYYYLLSPCKKFWGDTLSDKESIRLKNFWKKQGANEGSQEALEEYLRDRNPLLANFGRLGREMTQLTESMDSHSSETYVLPETVMQIPSYNELESSEDLVLEGTSSPLTLLEAVQADMALLRNPEADQKITFEGYDGTIQVHAAPKKSREVQVVYDALISILDRHANDASPILPGDIFVMAPNLAEYVPFIRSVFESPESRLDIQMMDLQVPSQSLLIQGFLHLLSLSNGRWEASALLQLFDYAAFRSRHRLSGEDVLVIRKWVKDAGINWGRDNHHRQEIFERDHHDRQLNEESLIGTWEHGLGRLLEGLAMSSEESPSEDNEGDYAPLDSIEMSQGDLLGVVVHLLRSLQEDLKILRDGTELTLNDWSTYLACLFDAYFLPGSDDEDIEGHRVLKTHMESFAKASKRLGASKFQFKSILRHLDSQLKRETTTYKESNLNSVRFSTLLPMRAVPAKVIVLMGMGDGVFPRADQTNTLNMLQENITDYSPSQVDFDRYIFLESILSARQYFILSYENQEPGNAKLQSPSLLIKELVGYLDGSYSIIHEGMQGKVSPYCNYNHSLLPFHQSYFMEASRFKSHSYSNYLAAISHYGTEKTPRQAFIGEFKPAETVEAIELQKAIDLKELLAYAKSPLKVYVNRELGIYIDQEEDRLVKDEEDLFLSDLNAAILSRQGLFGSRKASNSKAEKSGQIPHGPFKGLGIDKIERQVGEYLQNMKSLEINAKGIFSIEFKEHFAKPELTDDGWKVPAIALNIEGLGNVKIAGRLDSVCERGLVLLKKNDQKVVLEQWPSLLILRWLIAKYQLPIDPQVIFIKGEKSAVSKFKSEAALPSNESLENYIEHYLKTKSAPTPLIPDLIPLIRSGKTEELQNIFKDDANDPNSRNYDQYLTWFGRNSPKSKLESSGSHWQEKAQSLFVDLFEEKQSKKTASAKEDS